MKLRELNKILLNYNRITLTIYKDFYNDEIIFANMSMLAIKHKAWPEFKSYFDYKVKYIYANAYGTLVIVLEDIEK